MAVSSADKQAGRVLLPADVVPSKYTINLIPDMEKFTFEGEESILLQVANSTNTITLHSKEICIYEASFSSSNLKVDPVSIQFDLKLSTVSFVFAESLPEGEGTLWIRFQGCLNNQMAGFYRSSYVDARGEKKIMASTQFEALDARRCFPCWDEPAAKAVFELTLTIPSHLEAFSNMPEKSRGFNEKGQTVVTFMPSPKMSTYLLAMCVGEFDFVQGTTEHGVQIRVYTPPKKQALGTFALDIALKTLDFYDDFFQVPYPLPKLDMVAISEFAMGAMENWGLVTYREVDLLIDSEKASSQQKQRVCSVITHELAHQWFGNLVTMQWWDDLWLNEGFASWTQTFAADFLFPEWQMWQQFVIDDQAAALRLDSLRSSHPIQVPIGHAEEVEQVFDAISYCKGACVVRMLFAVLGKDNFQKGLQIYMDRHKYSNTETFDLWNAWGEASGLPINAMMASWTEQMGYPVVKVTKESIEGNELVLQLSQEWFLADGSLSAEDSKLNKKWTIPLIYSSSKTPEPTQCFMKEQTLTLRIPVDKDAWVKLNAGQHTLMRVLYTPSMLSKLEQGVRSKSLSVEDRASLLSDLYALCKAGLQDASVLIKFLTAYKEEDSYTVWQQLSSVFLGLYEILSTHPLAGESFKSFAKSLIIPFSKQIGWDSKTKTGHLDKLLRGIVINLLSTFAWDEESVQSEAKTRFEAHCKDVHSDLLPSDYVVPIYKIILKSGGEKEFNVIKALLDRFETNVEKKNVYLSLGYVSDPELKKKVMQWAVDEVKLQDFFYALGSVGGSGSVGKDIAWTFFKENYTKLTSMLSKASPSLMNAVILNCCGHFADSTKIDEVDAFFSKNQLPLSSRRISQMIEGMRSNAAFSASMASGEISSAAFWSSLSS